MRGDFGTVDRIENCQGPVSLTICCSQFTFYKTKLPSCNSIAGHQIAMRFAQMSCHVRNFAVITALESMWEWSEIPLEFELRWKKVSETGPADSIYSPYHPANAALYSIRRIRQRQNWWIEFRLASTELASVDFERQNLAKTFMSKSPTTNKIWFESPPLRFMMQQPRRMKEKEGDYVLEWTVFLSKLVIWHR